MFFFLLILKQSKHIIYQSDAQCLSLQGKNLLVLETEILWTIN